MAGYLTKVPRGKKLKSKLRERVELGAIVLAVLGILAGAMHWWGILG